MKKIQKYRIMQENHPDSLDAAENLCMLYHSLVINNTGLLWGGIAPNHLLIQHDAHEAVKQCRIILRQPLKIDDQLVYSEVMAEDAVTANNISQAKLSVNKIEKKLRYRKHSVKRATDNALFVIYEVLGRIAVKNRQWKSANDYLLKAGKVSGDPYALEIGPNMRLAHELLQHGERQVVVSYIKECMDHHLIVGEKSIMLKWIKKIRKGIIPAFGDPVNGGFGLWY